MSNRSEPVVVGKKIKAAMTDRRSCVLQTARVNEKYMTKRTIIATSYRLQDNYILAGILHF